jgi:hypothetical protein
MQLPLLKEEPSLHPDCCASLSTELIATLLRILPKYPSLILSIGCGTGLLEAQVLSHHADFNLEGVEVSAGLNKYLPKDRMNIASGTWDLCSKAVAAHAWMFVYPREPKLVRSYVEKVDGSKVESIVWLGPRADWPDFEGCFLGHGLLIEHVSDSGLAPYEMLVVVKRHPHIVTSS